MPAFGTKIARPAERAAFDDLLMRCVRRMRLRRPLDLAPFVERFVAVKFKRYARPSACVSPVKVQHISQLLNRWLAIPGPLPSPRDVQRTQQAVALLLLTRPASCRAWAQHLEKLMSPLLSPLPGKHQLVWRDATGAYPALEWTIQGLPGGALRVLVEADRAAGLLDVRCHQAEHAAWQLVCAGSCCHETWLRIVDFLWRCAQPSGTVLKMPDMDVGRQVGEKLRARMQAS